MPRRIRWNRFDGPLPEGVRLVNRQTRWGNPYRVAEHGQAEAVERFRAYAIERAGREPDWLAPLKGLDLACSCQPDQPCHADILIEMANH